MATASVELQCAFCGNPVTADGAEAISGRCGGAIRAWLATDRLDPDSLRIRENVPCKSCGYNLRTLPVDGVCPECAARVTLSLRREELHLADANWLARLTRGVNLLILAWVISGGLRLFYVVPGLGELIGAMIPYLLLWLGNIVAGSIQFAGFLVITAPEPTDGTTEKRDSFAGRARTFAILFYSVLMTWWLWKIAGTIRIPGAGWWENFERNLHLDTGNRFLTLVLFAAIVWLGALAVIFLLVYLRRLARRAGRPGLQRLLVAGIVLEATQAGFYSLQYLMILDVFGARSSWFGLLQSLYTALSLLALVNLFILVLCRRMFRSAGRISQALSDA